MAVDKLNKDDESIIVNADQIFDYNLNKTISKFRSQHSDAGVISFESVHPRWSYVKTDNEDNILQTAEKEPISKNAIAGFYYFKSFSLFIESAFNAIEIEDYYNDNLYTSALINQLILLNKKVINYKISPSNYKSFYSPQNIKEFKGIFKKMKNEKT
jgi:NDP-sugar pyrophosphorylase family protein